MMHTYILVVLVLIFCAIVFHSYLYWNKNKTVIMPEPLFMTVPASAQWSLGDTYTIEFSLFLERPVPMNHRCRFISIGDGNSLSSFVFELNASGGLTIGVAHQTAKRVETANALIVLGHRNDIAISTEGGLARVYYNHHLVAGPTPITVQESNNANPMYLRNAGPFMDYDRDVDLPGHVTNLTVNKGIAFYTGNTYNTTTKQRRLITNILE